MPTFSSAFPSPIKNTVRPKTENGVGTQANTVQKVRTMSFAVGSSTAAVYLGLKGSLPPKKYTIFSTSPFLVTMKCLCSFSLYLCALHARQYLCCPCAVSCVCRSVCAHANSVCAHVHSAVCVPMRNQLCAHAYTLGVAAQIGAVCLRINCIPQGGSHAHGG